MATISQHDQRLDGARAELRRLFGFDDFRGVQAQVVARVLAGESTLAVMPTGAGKSLTYQLPATMLPGTCVVVSPLIALMHDQLRAADYILKPVGREHLISVVSNYCQPAAEHAA